jgi:hypothetical protein
MQILTTVPNFYSLAKKCGKREKRVTYSCQSFHFTMKRILPSVSMWEIMRVNSSQNQMERRTSRIGIPCKKVSLVFHLSAEFLLRYELKTYLCVSISIELNVG